MSCSSDTILQLLDVPLAWTESAVCYCLRVLVFLGIMGPADDSAVRKTSHLHAVAFVCTVCPQGSVLSYSWNLYCKKIARVLTLHLNLVMSITSVRTYLIKLWHFCHEAIC
jgi:hypothetical protein